MNICNGTCSKTVLTEASGPGNGGEGAKFWLEVLTDLKNRRIRDILFVVREGLDGLPEGGSQTPISAPMLMDWVAGRPK